MGQDTRHASQKRSRDDIGKSNRINRTEEVTRRKKQVLKNEKMLITLIIGQERNNQKQ